MEFKMTEKQNRSNNPTKEPKSRTNPLWYIAIISSFVGFPLLFSIDNRVAPTGDQIRQQKVSQQISEISDGAWAIRKAMRNPDSFMVDSVSYNQKTASICYKYRAQNGFGGMNTEHTILENSGTFIYESNSKFSTIWAKECNSPKSEVFSAKTINSILKTAR